MRRTVLFSYRVVLRAVVQLGVCVSLCGFALSLYAQDYAQDTDPGSVSVPPETSDATQSLATETENALSEDALWLRSYQQRARWFVAHIGPLPDDVVKLRNMVGVWRGGGIVAMPAVQLQPFLEQEVWAYSTLGLSDADMPAQYVQESPLQSVENKEASEKSATRAVFNLELQAKVRAKVPLNMAGYGYEVLFLLPRKGMSILDSEGGENKNIDTDVESTKPQVSPPLDTWPVWVLQWMITAEVYKDAGILKRVMAANGLIVEGLRLGQDDVVHVLLVQPPVNALPAMQLASGTVQMLLAVVINDDELRWAKQYGHQALWQQLSQKPQGWLSVRGQASRVAFPAARTVRDEDVHDGF